MHYEGSFIYFGGWHFARPESASLIAKFDSTTRQWSRIGKLRQSRDGHGAIFDGANFIIVGGFLDEFYTESCTLNADNSEITCSRRKPILDDYSDYPELFIVPENFCKVN